MQLILRVVLARSSFSCMSCLCTGGRRDNISSSSAAIPFEHRQDLRSQDTGRRAKVKDSVGWVSAEEKEVPTALWHILQTAKI